MFAGRQKSLVDYCDDDDDQCRHGGRRHDGPGVSEPSDKEVGKTNKRRRKLSKLLENQIWRFLSVKLFTRVELCSKSRSWFNAFKFVDVEGKPFKNVLNVYRSYLSNLSLKEIVCCHYKNRLSVMYSCTKHDDRNIQYFEAYESMELLLQLLTLQFSEMGIRRFLESLYDLLNHRGKKKNCLQLVGPPNSGKTWFASIVGEFMLNVGYISNANKYNNFPYND